MGLSSSPRQEAQQLAPLFSAHVHCGQTVAHLSYCWGLVLYLVPQNVHALIYDQFLHLTDEWLVTYAGFTVKKWITCVCLHMKLLHELHEGHQHHQRHSFAVILQHDSTVCPSRVGTVLKRLNYRYRNLLTFLRLKRRITWYNEESVENNSNWPSSNQY